MIHHSDYTGTGFDLLSVHLLWVTKLQDAQKTSGFLKASFTFPSLSIIVH